MKSAGRGDWLGRLLRPLWPRFRELVAISMFVNLLALAVPVFVLQVYDRVVFHAGLTTLQGLVIGVGLAILFDYVLRQARSRVLQQAALNVDVDVGRLLFHKLTALPLRVLEQMPAARWHGLARDAEAVRDTVAGPPALLLVDLPFVVIFLGLIWLIAAPVVWVLLVAVPLFLLLTLWSSLRMTQAGRQERGAMQDRDAVVGEMISGRATLKALDMGALFHARWEARQAEKIKSALARGSRSDGYGNLATLLALATTIGLTAVGAMAIIGQELTIGALIAANMLTNRVTGPLNQLVGGWRNIVRCRQSVARLGEVFALAEDLQESRIELERPQGALKTEALRFAYAADAAPAVDGLVVDFGPGAVHGIVGSNGSGKSTLLKLLQGLYAADSGRVLIDDADIAQFSRAEIARWIGYVPQEVFLFAGTIRDNIAGGREVDDPAIVAAAEQALAHEFIVDLPDGYGTDVGEGGHQLSAGQRQRIAIARALVGDPAAVLLDEPTASLDRAAEERLRDRLRELAATKCVVLVTHSPPLLAACDDITVMQRGQVTLAGPAREVLPQLLGGPRPVAEGPRRQGERA